MTTDHIIVERQTDGEKCLEGCTQGRRDSFGDYRCAFYNVYTSDADNPESLTRCKACLSTPSAEVITEEQRKAVKNAAVVREAVGHVARCLDVAQSLCERPLCVTVNIEHMKTVLRAVQAYANARSEADAMLAAMHGECVMCGHGPGCHKDCDGFEHWTPKHDASPESIELLKALRLADKGKLAAALRAVQSPRLTTEQVEAVLVAEDMLEFHGEEEGAGRLCAAFPGVCEEG